MTSDFQLLKTFNFSSSTPHLWVFKDSTSVAKFRAFYVQTEIELNNQLQEFVDAETPEEAQDAIGDMFVMLIQIARLRGIYLSDALESAWNEIKDRKGTMIDGVFVKEA